VSQALTWTLFLIAEHADIEERIVAELNSVLGARDPRADDVDKLPFLTAVIHESMRLLPPVWAIMRTAIGPDTILGYPIPAGAVVILSAYVVQRSPAVWPDPERFDPDRFRPDRSAARHRFGYFPFGGGPRQCVGGSFAMLEMPVVIAMLLQRYRLRLVPGQDIRPVARLSVRPNGPVRMTVHARGNA
jgi:cytochrome P450